MNFSLWRELSISLEKPEKANSLLTCKHLLTAFSSSCLQKWASKEQLSTQHRSTLLELPGEEGGLRGLPEGKKKLVLHETVIAGALEVSGPITTMAIDENVFGFNCQTCWRWKKLYVFSNNNIWIIQHASVRHPFPSDPANPSAYLLTSTKPS